MSRLISFLKNMVGFLHQPSLPPYNQIEMHLTCNNSKRQRNESSQINARILFINLRPESLKKYHIAGHLATFLSVVN